MSDRDFNDKGVAQAKDKINGKAQPFLTTGGEAVSKNSGFGCSLSRAMFSKAAVAEIHRDDLFDHRPARFGFTPPISIIY